jgi:hypothetical protein
MKIVDLSRELHYLIRPDYFEASSRARSCRQNRNTKAIADLTVLRVDPKKPVVFTGVTRLH